MAEPTTAGYSTIDTQMLANAIVPPAIQSPTAFIAQDVRQKEIQPDLTASPFAKTPALFGTSFKEEPRALRGYANEYYEEANVQLSSGEYIPRYESFIAGTDNEERLAQKQTTSEKWVNGFEKLVGKTGVAVLGGTLGVADSLVEGISKGSLSEAYNTGFNNWLDDLNVKLDYKLPNYYTEQEKGSGLFEQTTQANFWADKVFGGLSFTAGALISEGIWTAATGGVGLLASESQLARLAKWTVKGVGGEEKTIAAMNAAKKMASGSSATLLETTAKNSKSIVKELGVGDNLLTTIAEGTKDASINAYKIRKIGDVALVATRSAGYEAGMEARQYMNSTEHNWLENYQKVNGHEPSAEEYSQFKDGLTTSANMVFGANMIIVGGSNIAQFGNALLGKTTNPLVGNNFLKRSLLGVGFDKTVSAEGKILYKALEATKGQKIAGKVWGVLGAALPEAQEEMGQRVVSQTAENYMMNAYDPTHTKTTYGVADAFTSALNSTYGTKEGLSEGLIGAIVGVLGAGAHSRFKFGDVTESREDIKRNVEYANGFTADTHLTNVMTNNQILASQENKKQAQQRGDLVGEVLADTTSAISYLDRANAIGDRHEAVADFSRQINAVSDAELAKELGLGSGEEAEKQASQFKEQKIVELKNLSDQHAKNLNYATALLGETEIAGLDKTSTRKVVAAMAYSMTMGETAMKANQDLVSHVKNIVTDAVDVQGITDALDVQQVLDLAPREKTLRLSQLNLQLFNLNKKEKETLNRQFEASKVSESGLATPEDSKARQNALIDINQELVRLQEEKQTVAEQKQLAVDAIGVKNFTGGDVTVEMFDKQNENLDKLRDTLESIQLQNPEKYFEIQKALQAQAKAVQHIKNYQKTTQALVNPNTRVKVLNGWITKLLNKNTKLNESTAAYFSDILESWETETAVIFQESDQLRERKAFQNGEEVSEAYKQSLGEQVRKGEQLNAIDQEIYDANQKEIEDNAVATIDNGAPVPTPPVKINTLQDLKNKVKEIITSSDYLTQYFGADLAEQNKTKPSEADVNEYTELLAKIDRNVEPNTDRIVSRPTGYYKNTGLTDAETNRLKELQTKLNDWVTLEGTVTQDSQSVAEMLDLIDALQTTAVKTDTKTELTDKDITTTIDAVDEQANSMGGSVRGLQTPTNALATISKNNVRFSHIRVETLASFFPNSILTVNSNKTFEIDLNNGQKIAGKINEKGGQDIPLKEWQKAASQSTVLIKNFGTNSSAISQFLGLDSQGKELYQAVPSDFDYQQTDGTNLTVDQVAVNQVKNGDTLDLFVSSTDSFNASLKKDELPSQIHIYVMKGGKLLGSLPASYDKESVDGIGMPLADLRKSAAEFTKGKKGLIKLPQKMTAQIVFIGAPQITLEKNSEGDVKTKNNPFTKEMLQNVVGQGFIENGQVTSTVKIDVNQFINKISGANKDTKIPFVAFNYNGKVVAFPISLNTFTVDKSEAVLEVFNSTEATTAIKAKTLVDALIANGLEASSYGIDFTDKEGWIDSQETQNALNDLSQIKEFVDLERFASKNYNTENLVNDATIAIDLANEPFQTSKIMLSMSNKIDTDVLGYREFLAENENREVEVRTALNEVAKEIQSKYLANEDLDNNFTQTLDETPIIKGEVSDVIMRQNINTLKTALKGASKKTKEVIGADLFKKAQNLIKELNSIENKTKDVKQQIKDSEYYQDIDTTFVTVDENGELENPFINQAEAIEEFGGIKTYEEFNNTLENSDSEYLKTANTTELFEDMSQFNNIPVKELVNGEVVDKVNTEVKDTLEATIKTPENNALEQSLSNLEGYSPFVWNSSPEAVKTLLREVEKEALKINVDLRGLAETYDTKSQEEILDITRALDFMVKNPSEASMNHFINVYQDFANVAPEIERSVVKVDEKYRELPLIAMDTEDSEYKLFKEQGLLKVQDGVYIKTDAVEKSLEEVENLSATNVQVFPVGTIQGEEKTLDGTFYNQEDVDLQEQKYDEEYDKIVEKIDKELEKKGIISFEEKSNFYRKDKRVLENIKKRNEFRKSNNNLIEQVFRKAISDIRFPTYFLTEKRQAQVEEDVKDSLIRRFKIGNKDFDFSSELKGFLEGSELEGLKSDIVNAFLPSGLRFDELSADQKTEALEKTEVILDSFTKLISAELVAKSTKKVKPINTALIKEDLNAYVESQMADVQTNDAEYDLDAVKKLIYYKTYFGTQNSGTQEKNAVEAKQQVQLAQLSNVEIKNAEYLKGDYIADVRNQQLNEEHPTLKNLVFDKRGITLRHTDQISVAEMNEYLKENEDLRNYFLLSKNTNFEVAVSQDALISERDLYVNGATKENFKGDYKTINSETVQVKTESDFITINGENYERIQGDFFAKLPKSESNFLELNVEQPTLNIDVANYNSVQSEAKIETSNKYSKEEGKNIDDSLACE